MVLLQTNRAELGGIDKEVEAAAIAPLLAQVALDVGAQVGAVGQRHVAEKRGGGGAGKGRKRILLLVAEDVFETLAGIVHIAERPAQVELGPARSGQIENLTGRQGGENPRRAEGVAIVVAACGMGRVVVAAI